MKRTVPVLLTVLLAVTMSGEPIFTAQATSWSLPSPLPNVDPYTNLFPRVLQTSNFSAGHGDLWVVWQKVTPPAYGQVYLMTHNRYGWSGISPLVNDTFDNTAPALAELANGTIVLVWSRGTGASGSYDLYVKAYNGIRWTNTVPLVQATGDDVSPSLTRTLDGRVWLVWSRATPTNGPGDLYYKVYDPVTRIWTNEAPVVISNSFEEKFPNVAQTVDGRVWVFYESNSAGYQQLWYRIWDLTDWGTPARFTTTTEMDKFPTMVQDRSGVLWVFWSRELPTRDQTNPFQWVLFYKNSTNNGATWGQETTPAPPPDTLSDQLHPSIAQAFDETLWVIYASDVSIGNPYGAFNLYRLRSNPIAGHDVAATNARPSPQSPRTGETPTIYVTVTNLGEYSETISLTAYVNSTLLGARSVTLSPGANSTLTFSWNSTGRAPGRYHIRASVATVPAEVLRFNNNMTASFLLVPKGDVNRDGIVNIIDLAQIAVRFGTRPTDPMYLADADLNRDGVINIIDLTAAALDFGDHA